MVQIKLSLTDEQAGFLERHDSIGYPNKSAVVRDAIDRLRQEFEAQRLDESAELYAEAYEEDAGLRKLTDAAIEDWPE